VPLLNAPYDIHRQLPVLLQRVLPVRGDLIREREVASHRAHHHLAHGVVVVGIAVDVLYPSQSGIRVVVVVEGADCLHDVRLQRFDLEFHGHEVEVKEGSYFGFLGGGSQGAGIEPANEHFEGGIVFFLEAEDLGFLGLGFVAVEDAAEEGGVVAEELFVDVVVGCVGAGADPYVYCGVGEEPGVLLGGVGGERWEEVLIERPVDFGSAF
jgi:hypothetical protein